MLIFINVKYTRDLLDSELVVYEFLLMDLLHTQNWLFKDLLNTQTQTYQLEIKFVI